MPSSPSKVQYTSPTGKTSLVDRMNLSIHLRKYIKLLTRRWLILVAGAAIGTGAAYHHAQKQPDVFRAYSKIFLAPVLVAGQRDQAIVVEEMAKFYLTQIDYMNSDQVIGKVRERLKDVKPASGLAPAASYSAEPGMSASIIMTVTGNDFEYVRKFAEVWAQEFKAYKDIRKVTMVDTEARTADLEYAREKARLDEIIKEIADFNRQHKEDAKDRGDSAQKQLETLQSQQLTLRTQREQLENMSVDDLATRGELLPQPNLRNRQPTQDELDSPSGPPDPLTRWTSGSGYTSLKTSLLTNQAERDKWAKTLKPKHPFMVRLAEKIRRDQDQITIVLKLLEDAHKAKLESLRKSENSLTPLIEQQRSVVQEARAIQRQYEELKSRELAQSKYVDSIDERRRTLGRTDTQDEKLEIMEAGKGDPRPIAPDRQAMILNGLLIGLAAAFGFIYFLNRLDDRLELAEDIEDELDEPVLGQVPQLDKAETSDGVVLVTSLAQHNTFAESLRGVRSAFLFGSPELAKQVLVVTSAVPGDGKTTLTVNFAATLAKAGNKVLLVDADLRRGNIHHYFKLPREGGLTEILIGEIHWEDAVKSTSVDTLHTITTGRLPGNPGELLISPINEQFIAAARKHYDYVLFDCPPLTSIDDTFCLLSLVDGLVFVVKAGHTSMRFAKNALAAVRHRGANIIGIILNGITTDHPGYYYYYYYHDYYKTAQEAVAKGETLDETQPGMKMAARRSGTSLPGGAAGISETGESPDRKAELFKARRSTAKSAADSTGKPVPSSEKAPEKPATGSGSDDPDRAA